jgi:asparagine synthase (glutamine-hydrolysing)
LARAVTSGTEEGIYRELVSQWSDPASLVANASADDARFDWVPEERLPDFASRMMLRDAQTYLPDDILVKLDRAAMAVGLETRVPLLDQHVVEFCWRLPSAMKCRPGAAKWALRQVLYRYVPRNLVDRPKMGFGVPIHSWLRGPLRDWAEELLARDRLAREGFLAPDVVRARWTEFLEGKGNWQYGLWNVLMFQAWLEQGRGS